MRILKITSQKIFILYQRGNIYISIYYMKGVKKKLILEDQLVSSLTVKKHISFIVNCQTTWENIVF